MKTLIVEDDYTSRLLLQEIIKGFGKSDVAENGREAIVAVREALDAKSPYDLICMDIMMPEMNGQEALVEIRRIEEQRGVQVGKGAKILMTTALGDKDNIMSAFKAQCDGYLVKPIQKRKFLEFLEQLNLIECPTPPRPSEN